MARHAEHQALALPMRPPRVPIHRWLYAEMRAAILNGRLASGQRLPPTRDLAHQFGIARGTAVAVFEQLAAEGYVTAAVGRGTHVASSLPDNLFTAVTPRTRLPKTSVRAIRLSDRARPLARSPFPLTGPTTPGGAFRAGQPDLMAFPVALWSRIANRLGDAASVCFSQEGTSRATGRCARPSPPISGHHAGSAARLSESSWSRACNKGSISVPGSWSTRASVYGWKILAIRRRARY